MKSAPIAGKFLLEILTRGMYSNPLHIYREYIQNSADSIDKAVASGLIDHSDAEIHIAVDSKKRMICVRDNGCGMKYNIAKVKLLSVGASDKDGINERGFRGIGRLGGLAYAEKVQFITSAPGEKVKTIMTCDCIRMQQLLQKNNTETDDIIDTFKAISSFEKGDEAVDEHYFEVRMFEVFEESGLLDEEKVIRYLAETAPVDFDVQQFLQTKAIREHFKEKGVSIPCYKILYGARKKSIYKLYSRTLSTGRQERTKNKDYVRDVEIIHYNASDGKPLFIGWLAITDFSGIISNESVQGIRLRKGNILVGNNTTFSKFFPSEGAVANKMFAGEIHVLHDELIPNSQRDDFEPGKIYNEMISALNEWAKSINKRYRRGTSEANSALRNLMKLNDEQDELNQKIQSGAITSDEKREQYADKIEALAKKRETEEKKVRAALANGIFVPEKTDTVEKTLAQTEKATKSISKLNAKVVNADFATKNDLPSSYGREQRKLYQRIISVIDAYFSKDPEIAEELRKKIIDELRSKPK